LENRYPPPGGGGKYQLMSFGTKKYEEAKRKKGENVKVKRRQGKKKEKGKKVRKGEVKG
jgi:hypothetical protein